MPAIINPLVVVLSLLMSSRALTAFAFQIKPSFRIQHYTQPSPNSWLPSAQTKLNTRTSSRHDFSSSSSQSSPPKSNIILFDGVCNFCNTWVDILLRLDVNEKFQFAPLQSETGQTLLASIGKASDDISSVVLVQPDTAKYYDKSACVLKVVEELGPLAGVLTKTAELAVPKSVRDNVYDLVAENRYKLMGKRDECRCSDPKYKDRFLD